MWRSLLSFAGTFLAITGAAGFALIVSAPRLPPAIVAPVAAVLFGEAAPPGHGGATALVDPPATGSAITRLVIPTIDLDTPVVLAPLVEHDGVSTWDVPKVVAGHAEGSAGAGESGNAILIGHVTSLTLGNVFEHLDGVVAGDLVLLYHDQRPFTYRVTEVRDVDRADTDVLDPTEAPSVTLITCSGLWLPTVHDYNQRLIVRAELEPAR
jgi:LPXTG-site transpeptidase (sortase) family protein